MAVAIQRETGQRVIPVDGDIGHETGAKAVLEEAIAQLGGLDVLMTNAGGPTPGNFGKLQLSDWETAYHLLIASVAQMIHTALPSLRQSKRAAILINTSLTVKQPADSLVLSNTLRAGLAGLVKSLANELGPEGIRVNGIMPGWTATDRVVQLLEARAANNGTTVEAERAKRQAEIPLRRMGTPEEFGKVAAFLCSPAAGFIHGAMIPVDGGEIRATM
jgi:3-oxoacyl-[acyl-carrier protein] reductase